MHAPAAAEETARPAIAAAAAAAAMAEEAGADTKVGHLDCAATTFALHVDAAAAARAAGALLQGSPDEARVAELLAAAAERRDKATCVKGGKQRALLAMAEKLENEAHALAAALKQQQNQQQHQHGGCDDPAYAPRDSARFGLPSGSSDTSFSSQVCCQPSFKG